MKFNILDNNGNIVNTIIAELEFVQSTFEHFEAIEEPIVSDAPKVPTQITPLQAKMQLYRVGLLDEVEAMVASDMEVKLYWEYALEIKRDHITLLNMATALGLKETQLDDLFIEASKIS